MGLFLPKAFSNYPADLPKKFTDTVKGGLVSTAKLDTVIVPFVAYWKGNKLEKIGFHLAVQNLATQNMKQGDKVAFNFISEQGYASGGWYQEPDASTLLFMQLRVVGSLLPVNGNEKITLLTQTLNRYETLWGKPDFGWESLPEMAKTHYPDGIAAYYLYPETVEFLPRLSQQRKETDRKTIQQKMVDGEYNQLLEFWNEV